MLTAPGRCALLIRMHQAIANRPQRHTNWWACLEIISKMKSRVTEFGKDFSGCPGLIVGWGWGHSLLWSQEPVEELLTFIHSNKCYLGLHCQHYADWWERGKYLNWQPTDRRLSSWAATPQWSHRSCHKETLHRGGSLRYRELCLVFQGLMTIANSLNKQRGLSEIGQSPAIQGGRLHSCPFMDFPQNISRIRSHGCHTMADFCDLRWPECISWNLALEGD